LQHAEIDCQRCGLLETRHRLALEEHKQDAAGRWVRDERTGGIGVLLLFVALLAIVVGCGWAVWEGWPR
jgi:hypothetical protein